MTKKMQVKFFAKARDFGSGNMHPLTQR